MGNYLPRGVSLDETFVASGDLSTYQYRFAKQTANAVAAICGAGERITGIIQNAPAADGQALLRTLGLSLLYVNATAAIAVGDHLKSGALGVGVKGEADLDEVGAVAREAKASGVGTILVKLIDAVSISEEPPDEATIVVSTAGSDEIGSGSFANPFATIAHAVTLWTAERHTIIALSGEYDEAALVWPSITGLSLVCLGDVVITNSDNAAAVLTIAPTYTAATFEATIKGRPTLVGTGAQIGLAIANAAMTKKLDVYLPDGIEAEAGTSGDSIDIAGTVAGQAIRLYADGPVNLEGLLHFTANDAGSRLRLKAGGELMGGLTCTGAVAAECELKGVTALTSGVTVATEWLYTHDAACVYATDADPRVYSEFAAAYQS